MIVNKFWQVEFSFTKKKLEFNCIRKCEIQKIYWFLFPLEMLIFKLKAFDVNKLQYKSQYRANGFYQSIIHRNE